MINSVQYQGNLTRNPEISYTPKGVAVLNATLANTHRFVTDSGEEQEETAFINVTIWGQRAVQFARFHVKGTPALVEGRLITDTWDDKSTGQKKSKTRIRVEQWHFVGPKRDPIDLPQNNQTQNVPFA